MNRAYKIFKNGKLDEHKIVEFYDKFIENMREFNKVFQPMWLSSDDLFPGGEGKVWSWDSDEEKVRTAFEILNYGIYFPMFVLEKGAVHPNDLQSKEYIGENQYYTLDGSHRSSAIKYLKERKLINNRKFLCYKVPIDCSMVRTKLKEGTHNIPMDKRSVNVMTYKPAILFLDIELEKDTIQRINVTDKLIFFNSATSIMHNLTEIFYYYYTKNGKPIDAIANKMRCFNDYDEWENVINDNSR